MKELIYKALSVVYLISSRNYENMITYLMVFIFFMLSCIMISLGCYEIMFEYLPENKFYKQLIVLFTQALPLYFVLRFLINKKKVISYSEQTQLSKKLGLYKFCYYLAYIISFLLFIFFAGSNSKKNSYENGFVITPKSNVSKDSR